MDQTESPSPELIRMQLQLEKQGRELTVVRRAVAIVIAVLSLPVALTLIPEYGFAFHNELADVAVSHPDHNLFGLMCGLTVLGLAIGSGYLSSLGPTISGSLMVAMSMTLDWIPSDYHSQFMESWILPDDPFDGSQRIENGSLASLGLIIACAGIVIALSSRTQFRGRLPRVQSIVLAFLAPAVATWMLLGASAPGSDYSRGFLITMTVFSSLILIAGLCAAITSGISVAAAGGCLLFLGPVFRLLGSAGPTATRDAELVPFDWEMLSGGFVAAIGVIYIVTGAISWYRQAHAVSDEVDGL